MNSENEVKLRKYKHTLSIMGAGVILFGVWSLVKLVFYLIFDFERLEKVAGASFEGIEKIIFSIAAIVIIIFDILFRLYVGRCAAKEARGGKKRYLYIIFGIVIILVSVTNLFKDNPINSGFLEIMAYTITEITSTLVTAQMVFSAIMVKRLSLKCKAESEGGY